jgi:phosphoglycolate phosphatase
MLLSVMRELSFTPERTAMVGDTTMDIHMGLAANANTLGVAWGAHPASHLLDAGAHAVIDTHCGDIVPALRKLLS